MMVVDMPEMACDLPAGFAMVEGWIRSGGKVLRGLGWQCWYVVDG
jgi:hypothetical protein